MLNKPGKDYQSMQNHFIYEERSLSFYKLIKRLDELTARASDSVDNLRFGIASGLLLAFQATFPKSPINQNICYILPCFTFYS